MLPAATGGPADEVTQVRECSACGTGSKWWLLSRRGAPGAARARARGDRRAARRRERRGGRARPRRGTRRYRENRAGADGARARGGAGPARAARRGDGVRARLSAGRGATVPRAGGPLGRRATPARSGEVGRARAARRSRAGRGGAGRASPRPLLARGQPRRRVTGAAGGRRRAVGGRAVAAVSWISDPPARGAASRRPGRRSDRGRDALATRGAPACGDADRAAGARR